MTTGFYIYFGVITLVVILQIKYNFNIDITKEKHVLLWYNSKNLRKFIKLF